MLSAKRLTRLLGAFVAVLLVANAPESIRSVCLAKDWPQINGPNRNGVAEKAELLPSWPKDGPKVVWSRPIGQGFAGPAIKDNRLVIFHRPQDKYLVEALDATTGEAIWNRELPCKYGNRGMEGDAGPKAVPLIHQGKVILLGTGGNLFCLDADKGETVWELNVLEKYRSPSGYFGVGSSPIAFGNNVMVMVGGDNAAVVAFDIATGKEIWKSFDDRATYSSPISTSIDGKPVIVFVTRLYVLGLDPADGTIVFKTEFGKRGTNAIGAMPVANNGHLFVNAAYGMGGTYWKFSGKDLEKVWSDGDSFASHYSTPVFLNGYFYGTTGRIDYNTGSYRCVEAATGKVTWKQDNFPVGHTLLIDNRLVVLDSGGSLSLLMPSISNFRKIASARIFDGQAFAMPAFDNGRLYARSNAKSGSGKLVCLQLGDSKEQSE